MVWLVGRPSERELDWVLMGPETPCPGADKILLPGLSTNRMVQCDLVFADRVFAAADPSCRRFRWCRLWPEHQAPAAAAASLPSGGGPTPSVWAALDGLVPSQKDS